MTNESKFAIGDKVTVKKLGEGTIRQLNNSGTAALIETGEGDTYACSWYTIASFRKASARKAAEPKPAPPAVVPPVEPAAPVEPTA